MYWSIVSEGQNNSVFLLLHLGGAGSIKESSMKLTRNSLIRPQHCATSAQGWYSSWKSHTKRNDNDNWRRHSITILCRILVCFFFFFVQMSWFLRVVSNCSENHSPVFFSPVCASFSSKNVCKKQAATGHFADFIVWEKKRFLLLVVQQQTAKSAAEFFCIRFNWKTKRKPAEKNTGLWLSIKSENTCKNSAHLDEKKNRPKFDIEWLCCDVFNWFMLSMQILSYGCMREVWRAREKCKSCSRHSLASWVLSKLPKCIHNSIYTC